MHLETIFFSFDGYTLELDHYSNTRIANLRLLWHTFLWFDVGGGSPLPTSNHKRHLLTYLGVNGNQTTEIVTNFSLDFVRSAIDLHEFEQYYIIS